MFDIDKMFMMIPSFSQDENDNLVYAKPLLDEEGNELPLSEQPKEVLQNKLIESYKAVFLHPDVVKDVLTPIDHDHLEKDIKTIRGDVSKKKDLYHFDVINQIDLKYSFLAGIAGVGQWSNQLVDHVRGMFTENSLRDTYIGWGHKNENNETVFDKQFSEDLNNEDSKYIVKVVNEHYKNDSSHTPWTVNDVKNYKIADSLSAGLNGNVDIAKDPFITDGNYVTQTNNVVAMMLRAGMHPMYVNRFITQPIIKKYVDFVINIESKFNKDDGDQRAKFLRQLAYDKLEGQALTIGTKTLDYNQINRIYKGKKLDKVNLIKGFKEYNASIDQKKLEKALSEIRDARDIIYNLQTNEFNIRELTLKQLDDQRKNPNAALQLELLNEFYSLQDHSKTIVRGIKAAKPDTEGPGKDLSSRLIAQNLIEEIKSDERNKVEGSLTNFRDKLVDPTTKQLTILGHYVNNSVYWLDKVTKANPKLFQMANKHVENTINTISQQLRGTKLLNEKIADQLYKDYYTYSLSGFEGLKLKSSAKLLFIDLASELTNEKLENEDNYFLNQLEVIQEDGLNFIKLQNKKRSKDVQNLLYRGWKDLFEDNKELATKLVKYAYYQSGFNSNINEFFSHIPHEYFVETKLNRYIYDLDMRTNGLQTKFIDQMYRHNFNNTLIVPKIPEKLIKDLKPGKSFIVYNINRVELKPFVTFKNALLKLEGYDDTGNGIYVNTFKLGIEKNNGDIIEYKFDTDVTQSQLPANNPKNLAEINEYVKTLQIAKLPGEFKSKTKSVDNTLTETEVEFNEMFDETTSDAKTNIREIAKGVKIIDNALNSSEELEIFEMLKPFIQEQGFKTNAGKSAPLMIGLNLRWDYKNNNRDKTAITIKETINNSAYQKSKYGYYDVSVDGKPLGKIPNRLKELMTKATGVDASNYDGAIINIYKKNSFISAHNDVDESATAIGYPVLVVNIGGEGSLSIEGSESQRANKSYANKSYLNESLSSGSAYIFGDNGDNRDVFHRTLPSGGKGTLPALNVRGENIPANSYRISVTLRRVRDLEPGMPEIPSKGVLNTKTEYQELVDEYSDNDDLPSTSKSDGEYTFKHNNISIDTSFKLGEEQTIALRNSIDYIENPGNNKFFTIEGSAGTGKTTIIGYLQKYFDKKGGRNEFRYLAPTHAATAQLALTTVDLGNIIMPSTLASSFYSFKNAEGKLVKGFQTKLNVDGFANYTLIVDEASMIEDGLIVDFTETAKENGINVIFMGDSNQIPSPDNKSINNKGQKVLNRAFGDKNSTSLTKVYRQNKSDLLSTLDVVKANTEISTEIIQENNDGTIQNLTTVPYNKKLMDDFSNNLENTIYVAYTNAAVKSFNRKMKKALTGSDKLLVGDKIMGYAGNDTKQLSAGNIANSIPYMVTKYIVSENTSFVHIEAKSKLLDGLINKGVEGLKKISESIYVQLNFTDSIIIESISNEDMDSTNKLIGEAINKLYEEYINIPNGSFAKKTMKDKINLHFGKYDFGDDYYFNPKTKLLQLQPALRGADSILFSTKKGLDYGYSITAHKSQGMTVDNVYVDFDNIYNSRADRFIVNKKGDIVNREKNALYYVALSRARNKVIMKSNTITTITKPKVIETKPVKIDINQLNLFSDDVNSKLDEFDDGCKQ